METKEVLLNLRNQNNLSQDEMAARLLITRQAVSRWECGETIPNTETLKLISKEFGVSINTLLCQPVNFTCQSCGMPMKEDEVLSRDTDGVLNEHFCKWCYDGGQYVRECSIEEMAEEILPHMNWPDADAARKFLMQQLPQLERWKTK